MIILINTLKFFKECDNKIINYKKLNKDSKLKYLEILNEYTLYKEYLINIEYETIEDAHIIIVCLRLLLNRIYSLRQKYKK